MATTCIKKKAVAEDLSVYATTANSVNLELYEARKPTRSAGNRVLPLIPQPTA